MSENSHYPPDYWKIKNENAMLDRELYLSKQVSVLLQEMLDLEKDRLEMCGNQFSYQEAPLQVTRKGSCKLIQFVPSKMS